MLPACVFPRYIHGKVHNSMRVDGGRKGRNVLAIEMKARTLVARGRKKSLLHDPRFESRLGTRDGQRKSSEELTICVMPSSVMLLIGLDDGRGRRGTRGRRGWDERRLHYIRCLIESQRLRIVRTTQRVCAWGVYAYPGIPQLPRILLPYYCFTATKPPVSQICLPPVRVLPLLSKSKVPVRPSGIKILVAEGMA